MNYSRTNKTGPARDNRRIVDDSEDQSIVKSCRDLPYLCPKCKSLLAFVDAETKSVIRIKFKDMYVYIEDAKQVTIPCRSCGFINSIHRVEEVVN